MSSSKKAALPTKTPRKPTVSAAAPKFGASTASPAAANASSAAGAPAPDPTTTFRRSGVTLVAADGSAAPHAGEATKAASTRGAAGASTGTAQPATASRALTKVGAAIASRAGPAASATAARRPPTGSPSPAAAEQTESTAKERVPKAAPRAAAPRAASPRKPSASAVPASKTAPDKSAVSTGAAAAVSPVPRRPSSTRPAVLPTRTASPSRPRSKPAEQKAPVAGGAARASAGTKAATATAPTGAEPKAADTTGHAAKAEVPRRSTVESVGTTPEATPAAAAAAAAAAAPAATPPAAASGKVVWQTVRPRNQAALNAEQLDEDLSKVLVGTNPAQTPQNHVRWSHQEQMWKRETSANPVLTHFASQGYLQHRSQDGAAKLPKPAAKAAPMATTAGEDQAAQGTAESAVAPAAASEAADITPAAAAAAEDQPPVQDGSQPDLSASAVETTLEVDDSWQHRKLRNILNFHDSNAQTTSSQGRRRERGLMTEPPITNSISGLCTQVDIYDAYVVDLDDKRAVAEAKAAAEREAKRRGVDRKDDLLPIAKPDPVKERAKRQAQSIKHAAHMLERMIQQNIQGDVIMDMRYWEDESDALRPKEGTLLPLYRFTFRKAKNKAVTALVWHPNHLDYIAVGYGSYDFFYEGAGAIACFSLKNASVPEHHYILETGVMCLDFHREQPHLLAVGCKDGSVCIFDLRSKSKEPLARSSMSNMRHVDPVWNVIWRPPDLQAVISFAAVSTDGYVTLWILHKGQLTHKDLKCLDGLEHLKWEVPIPYPEKKPDNSQAAVKKPAANADDQKKGADDKAEDVEALLDDILAFPDDPVALHPELDEPIGGYCMDFKPPGPDSKPGQDLYLVGTDTGEIVKCNTAINSHYAASYKSHHMPVYTVRWNHLHTRTFLSCGADWQLKVWDEAKPKRPILDWDLGVAVGDVAWAPYSSTTFAAVTVDGKVHVYNVDKNIMGAMCSQKIARKAKLTKLAFNPRHPIIAVGEEKGVVTMLKLSPNLRQLAKEKKEPEAASTSTKKTAGRIDIAKILGLDKPATPLDGVDGQAAVVPKLSQAEMEFNKMEAVLKDIEKRGTIRYD